MRTRLTLLAGLLALLSACGGASPPDRWAGAVCTALRPWMAEISELTDQANVAMSPDSTPDQAKEQLLGLLAGAADASQAALDGVTEAGVPDVPDGEHIASVFTDSLSATRDAYRGAHDELAGLDASASDFYDQVAVVMAELVEEYASVPQVAELNSEPLSQAFAESPECA